MKNQQSLNKVSNKEKNGNYSRSGAREGNGESRIEKNTHQDPIGPFIGIEPKKLEKIHQILNKTLSNQHVLYVKTRNFHWNLVGHRFHPLHVFLEEQYKALEIAIDETAERTRMLGGTPFASMKEFLENASLEEQESGLIDGDEVVEILLDDNERVIQDLRKQIDELDSKLNDVGTSDFLVDLLKAHEKTAWMLRSHLE
jgi:starvation-inducible DNA-binding protein